MAKKQLIPEPTSPSGFRLSEQESRQALISRAIHLKCLPELKKIFQRYDGLLKKCTNVKERESIGAMGTQEIHNLFSFKGSLVVDGKEIIKTK